MAADSSHEWLRPGQLITMKTIRDLWDETFTKRSGASLFREPVIVISVAEATHGDPIARTRVNVRIIPSKMKSIMHIKLWRDEAVLLGRQQ